MLEPEPTFRETVSEGGELISSLARTVFSGLVGLSLQTPANWIGRRFPLNLRLEVDDHALTVRSRPGMLQRITETLQLSEPNEPEPLRLIVRLRHCYVRAECHGVRIDAESKYRSAIEVGNFRESSVSSANSSSQASQFIQGGISGSITTLVGLSAAGATGGESKRVNTHATEHVVTATRDLYEVEVVPGGWRIGDRSQGDPLKADGCLNGQYFGRPIENYPSTCMIEFEPNHRIGAIHFRVTTRDGIHVQRTDGMAAIRQEQSLAERAMRDRLASIRIESELFHHSEAATSEEITLLSLRCDCVEADQERTSG